MKLAKAPQAEIDRLMQWLQARENTEDAPPPFMRVVFGYETLVANCCDPKADVLEFKPELLAAKEDKARLDFLEDDMGYHGGGTGGTYTFNTPLDAECGMLRAAIDAKKRLVESVQLKPNARGLSEG